MRQSKDFRILVTGASGFVGSHLIEYFLSQGYTDIWGTTSSHSTWLEKTVGKEKALQVDLSSSEKVFPLIETLQPDWIVHLAGLAVVGESFVRALEIMRTNTDIQYVMLEAVRRYAPQARVLSIGSANEYGLLPAEFPSERIHEEYPLYPSNPYAVSKVTQDMLALSYALSYGTDVVRVRPFNQIGPRQTAQFALPAFAQQIVEIERGQRSELLVGNLDAVRDFTDVRDAVQVYELLLLHGKKGEVYNLGSGHGRSLRSLLELLCSFSTVSIPIKIDPERIRPVDVPVFVADNQKITSLGWEPRTPIEQTLRDILEHERHAPEQE